MQSTYSTDGINCQPPVHFAVLCNTHPNVYLGDLSVTLIMQKAYILPEAIHHLTICMAVPDLQTIQQHFQQCNLQYSDSEHLVLIRCIYLASSN